ncbi:glutathione-dependent disulfide-bond oxidoreductase [Psychrosphaera sp. B3R10]|uniref:glutathione-dependent disulfide-bond oxidoreductase n=1 Tax=unclassified Psychrosphaera TaxID=2641570 RepID=UPI001C087548|nr:MULTISPECIES: glutathione-dependent disulfide-bond oxidoreductase [unclassified Psychrosphaera]MBU2880379.1 glutathione-dependent disulfide-bond oxidoreductase [Psychrosphaera sp. I2R16]MBU2987818.1 glutathione-dependent disulfide-bond oxidoreductase [Psychrosphaera sp. B3R10]
MSDKTYEPPKVWKWQPGNGGKFASINRPIAGATHEKPLPVGKHPLQLHSLGTPNGIKVTILLEELLAAGESGAEYDAFLVDIFEGQQFSSGFVEINPNSKIPAMIDQSTDNPTPIFESGSIMLYLAEKFNKFIPTDHAKRTQCLSWLFWQMGSAPFVGGGFGHFYAYAPEKYEYPIERYTMEVKRQLDVLDRHLANNQFMCGDEYTIADIAIWAWYGTLVLNRAYDAAEYLDTKSYTHLVRWTEQIAARDAVKRGCKVNKVWGEDEDQLHERHDASDFDTKTQDKLKLAQE